MADVFLWLIVVQSVGLVAFPVSYTLFPYLADRGYALSKTLGVLLATYIMWSQGSLGLIPATQFTSLSLLLLMALGSFGLLWKIRQEFVVFLKREKASLVVIEIVFVVLFLVWTWYRSHDPFITHTEQPMDFAFLNAALLAESFPPADPWLLGSSISYYYLGYLMMSLITEITGIVPSVAYNLALAFIPALAGATAFSIVVTLVRASEAPGPRLLLKGWAFGGVAVILMLISSNLLGPVELLRLRGVGSSEFWSSLQVKGLETAITSESWYPQEHWWWWRASRIIDTVENGQSLDYTINEFPFFSLLLGDLHPHLMALPVVLLLLALCVHVVLDRGLLQRAYSIRRLPFYAIFALSLGALGFVNIWDLPVFGLFASGVIFFRLWLSNPSQSLFRTGVYAFPLIGGLLACSLGLYIPFYQSFSSQAGGILPLDGPITSHTHFLIIWAIFLVPVVFMVCSYFLSLIRQDRRLSPYIFGVGGVVLSPFLIWALAMALLGEPFQIITKRFIHLSPLLVLQWGALYGLLEGGRRSAPLYLLTALGLILAGVSIIVIPELFYVVDMFDSRMNTVFKMHYQAWVLLSLGSAVALYHWQTILGGMSLKWVRTHRGVLVLFSLLLASSLYYPIAAPYSKAGAFTGNMTLDGLGYLIQEDRSEYEAIQFLRTVATSDVGILEGVGDDYSSHGRISASTGIPTLLGWENHELQWRGSNEIFNGRREVVDRIYQHSNPLVAEQLLRKYGVVYVVVGPREVNQYGPDTVEKFSSFMDVVFSRDRFVIYQLRSQGGDDE